MLSCYNFGLGLKGAIWVDLVRSKKEVLFRKSTKQKWEIEQRSPKIQGHMHVNGLTEFRVTLGLCLQKPTLGSKAFWIRILFNASEFSQDTNIFIFFNKPEQEPNFSVQNYG